MTQKALWHPDENSIANSHLRRYMDWLSAEKDLHFQDYDALYEWSVKDTESFWQSIWQHYGVIDHAQYTQIKSEDAMPHTKWFTGSEVNYAEHLMRQVDDDQLAIISVREDGQERTYTKREVLTRAASLRSWMMERGVSKGDRVVAYISNCAEATISFLATASIGAIWSSCSPDFGAASVADRFEQIEPKLMFAVTRYNYGGKEFDKADVLATIVSRLPSLKDLVLIDDHNSQDIGDVSMHSWQNIAQESGVKMKFDPVPFDHPLWVLFSSGTTGAPKAITHSHGGNLIEHLKYVYLHHDVKPGERYFWFTTTGWMMWNFVQATLLAGSTIVLYDGNPGYPDLHVLWKMVERWGINHFGISAPFILANMKRDMNPGQTHDLTSLRSINSTGAPLPEEAFKWIYSHVKKDVWLASISGGTDMCTAFVGGVISEPVYAGEIQRRCLGCKMESYDDEGGSHIGKVGEMVITEAMPSMPVYFWNDPGYEKYKSSYFEHYPGVWRHGDWLLITERNTLVILGRSDATLNRQGVRIGTAEIYSAIDQMEEIEDSLIVNIERTDGSHFMPLFVQLAEGQRFNEDLVRKIKRFIRSQCSPRHVPDELVEVDDIPYTISGKKLEAPVKKILMGKDPSHVLKLGAMKNPRSIQTFIDYYHAMEK